MSHHASPAEAPLPGRQGSGATFLTAVKRGESEVSLA